MYKTLGENMTFSTIKSSWTLRIRQGKVLLCYFEAFSKVQILSSLVDLSAQIEVSTVSGRRSRES